MSNEYEPSNHQDGEFADTSDVAREVIDSGICIVYFLGLGAIASAAAWYLSESEKVKEYACPGAIGFGILFLITAYFQYRHIHGDYF